MIWGYPYWRNDPLILDVGVSIWELFPCDILASRGCNYGGWSQDCKTTVMQLSIPGWISLWRSHESPEIIGNQGKILTRLYYFSELEIGKIFKNPDLFLRSKELWVIAIDSVHVERWLIWNRPLSARNLSKLGIISKQDLIKNITGVAHENTNIWSFWAILFSFLGFARGDFFEGNSCDSTMKSM